MPRKNNTLDPQTIRLLFRYLAAAVRNQTSLSEVLKLLAQDTEASARSTAVLRQLAEHQTAQARLSDTLSQVDGLLAPETLALIRHAEENTCLPQVLDALAGDCQRQHLNQVAVRDAMTWPLTIAAVMIVLAFVVLVFVAPAFQAVYRSFGADLPGPTRLMFDLSDLLEAIWWAPVALVIAGFIAYWFNRFPKQIADLFWRACLAIPVVKAYFVRAFAARLANWLLTLHGDPAGLAAAARHLGATSRTPLLRQCAATLAERLGQQMPLATALQDVPALPKGLSLTAQLGQTSGDLPGALALGLELADEQAITATNRFGRWLFIASYVGVGLIAGFFILSLYLPIFKLGSVV